MNKETLNQKKKKSSIWKVLKGQIVYKNYTKQV